MFCSENGLLGYFIDPTTPFNVVHHNCESFYNKNLPKKGLAITFTTYLKITRLSQRT